MSVNTNESIYNLIPDPVPPKIRTSRYRSKFNDSVKEETKHSKASSKTMGPAKVPINQPKEYLKRKPKNDLTATQSSPPARKSVMQMKPAVPRHDERPQMGKKTTKNFVTTNAIENITTIPKKPIPKYVDSPQGATFKLEGSGLAPEFIHKKDYGKAPGYLEQRKIDMEKAQAEYERYIQESFQQGQMKKIEGEERQQILDGLKKNWDDLHREYQGLSVVTDTVAKKARKEKMEADMKQLEKDIEVIERHRVIYVENS